jgi:hypothetical protein
MRIPSLVQIGEHGPVRSWAAVTATLTLSLVLASCSFVPAKETEQVATASPPPDPEPPLQPQEPKPAPGTLWEWNGNGRSVSHIWVDVEEQRARFYDGSEQIGWSYVASGLKSHPTPVGSFAVMEKISKKRSNLYGKIYNAGGGVVKSDAKFGRDPIPEGGRFVGASMPYFMRLTYDGVGMHAGRIPVPGFPASHGCIRMPKAVAPVLYKHVALGTPVTITGGGPDYGNYAERQRLARAPETAKKSASKPAAAEETARDDPAKPVTTGGAAPEAVTESTPPAALEEATAPSMGSSSPAPAEEEPRSTPAAETAATTARYAGSL